MLISKFGSARFLNVPPHKVLAKGRFLRYKVVRKDDCSRHPKLKERPCFRATPFEILFARDNSKLPTRATVCAIE